MQRIALMEPRYAVLKHVYSVVEATFEVIQ